MTNLQTPWQRLQAISCYHSAQLWAATHKSESHYVPVRYRQCYVPDVIKENVEILGRGNDEELKHRVLWYVTFYPAIFSAAISASVS